MNLLPSETPKMVKQIGSISSMISARSNSSGNEKLSSNSQTTNNSNISQGYNPQRGGNHIGSSAAVRNDAIVCLYQLFINFVFFILIINFIGTLQRKLGEYHRR